MADEAVTSDRPISHLREDRLGRERFVRELGTTLATLGGTDSTVVALHGPWGSGKTSILNMVEEVLGENQHNLVLRFNPWLFSGAADLVGHFFRDLAGQLHEKRDKRLQALGNALDEYGRFLAPLTGISDTGPLGKAVKRWGRALPESVESQRKLLTQMLLQFDRQVVVLIDDIDRLAPDEVRDVMRLVRLDGDLPRTRYLLAFDRARVAKALSDEYEDGQAYIEKIVQAAFEVPEPLWVNLTAALVDVVHPYFEARYLSASEGDKRNILGAVIRPLKIRMDHVHQ